MRSSMPLAKCGTPWKVDPRPPQSRWQVEHTLSTHGRVPRVPQAWAAGSVFHLLQAILGLHADAHKRTLYLNPVLPPWLPEITLHNLRVGTTRVTIRFWRERDQNRHDVLSSRAEIQMKAGIATRYQPSTSSGPSQDGRGTQRGGRDHRCMSASSSFILRPSSSWPCFSATNFPQPYHD